MISARFGELRFYVRRMIGLAQEDRLSDGKLLERFVRHGDESSFEAIVNRYGRLVFGVCRRMLRNPHDAEDAFQATFLVLVRRAGSLDRTGSLGNWLYAVAYRTALKARSGLARRQQQEFTTETLPEIGQEAADSAWTELRPVLDEELSRLPEKYRAPLVLCCLQGKSHQEAARELGWASGSMSRRMTKARELLRERLVRRGVLLSSGMLLFLMTKKAAAFDLPVLLAGATAKAGALVQQGGSILTSGFSSEAVVLAERVLGVLTKQKKLSTLTASLVTLCVVGLSTPAVWAMLKYFGSDASFEDACGPRVASTATAPGGWRLEELGIAPGEVEAMAVSPNGQTLATSTKNDGGVIKLWSLPSGAKLAELSGHAGSVHSLAFDGTGSVLASASEDASIRIWNTSAGTEKSRLLGHSKAVRAVVFEASNQSIASASDDSSVRFWDLHGATERWSWSVGHGPVRSLAYSPDGKTVAAGNRDGTVCVCDVENKHECGRVTGHKGPVLSVAFSPTGEVLATGGEDKSVRLWNTSTWKATASLKGHTGPVHSITFAAGGNLLASASEDATLRLWFVKLKKEKLVLNQHTGPINALSSAQEGYLLATAGRDQTVRIWKEDFQ